MPLSEDQRAMLQLMLERGQSYEDIGSLLGLGVAEVRARARDALTEMAGEDPDAEVGLTDYLLGQADPIGRADAARHLQADPEANALAEKLEAQLRLLAPGAQLPDLPQAKAPRAPKRSGSAAEAKSAGAGAAAGPASLSSRQRTLIAALLAGGALVAVIVLIATGAFDGDGGGESPAAAGADTVSGSTTAANSDQVTKAVLRPLDGGSSRGVALFGRLKTTPVVQLTAIGLDQPGSGEAYYAWLTDSTKLDLPIGGFVVDQKGRVVTQIKIPTQALELVANETFTGLEITKAKSSEYQSAVTAAAKKNTFPELIGASVLRGEIAGPIVGSVKSAAPTGPTGSSGG